MRTWRAAFAAVMTLASAAFGQQVVVEFDGTFHNTYSPGTAIALSVPTSVDLVNVYGANSSGTVDFGVSIGSVSLSSISTTGNPNLDILIGDGNFPVDQFVLLSRGASNLAGVTVDASLRGKCRIAGALAGNLMGAIDSGVVFHLDVNGDVLAPITGRPLDGQNVAIDQLRVGGAIGANATIEAVTGNIQRVVTGVLDTTGGVSSPILAPHGRIGELTSAGPITIADPRGVQASMGISKLEAPSIAGNVTTNVNSGGGSLVSFVTSAGGLIGNLTTGEVPFVGDANAEPAILINGDLIGNLHVQGNLIGGIRILGGFASTEGPEGFDGGITIDGDAIGWVHMDEFLNYFRCHGDLYSLVLPGPVDVVAPGFVKAPNIGEVTVDGVGLYSGVTGFFPPGYGFIANSIWTMNVGGGYISIGLPPPLFGTEPELAVRLGTLTSSGPLLGTYYLASVSEFNVGGSLGDEPPLSTGLPNGLYIDNFSENSLVRVGRYLNMPFRTGRTSPLPGFETHHFHGQVIVNASNTGGRWGIVHSRRWGNITPIFSDSLGRYESPASAAIGGGAVGQVPYHVFDVDCNPAHDEDWDDEPGDNPMLNHDFNSGARIAVMSFYGPVRSTAPDDAPAEQRPVTFWYWLSRTSQWREITDAVFVEMIEGSDTGHSRFISITANAKFPPGYYAATVNLVPRDPANGQFRYNVICDDTLALDPSTPAANINGALEYHFRLWPDCNQDGVLDPVLTLCHEGSACCADLAGGGTAGTNPDGAVSLDDLIAFLTWFEIGQFEADIADSMGACTPDGGVNINDLLAFLSHFEAGC